MKRLWLLGLLMLSSYSFAQGADTTLQGRWQLFQIIDNMSGANVELSHKGTDTPNYWIEFAGNTVRYKLEINTCNNEVIVGKDHSIEFKYFSECTEICCDGEFSELLSYADCTNYYIKKGQTLILVSEDRIFYFKRIIQD